MGYIYKESILQYQQKYVVQDISKFPKTENYLIGTNVLLTDLANTSASIVSNGRKKWIPTRALIKVNGYIAKGVAAKNADGFVVVAKNTLGIAVGTAFINPDRIENGLGVFSIEGKVVKVPLAICCSLVKVKEKVSVNACKELKALRKDPDAVPEEVIEAIDSSSNRLDIDGIPESVTRLLPNLNLKDIKESLYHSKDAYSDYDGNVHETIAECDKANTIIRNKLIQEACTTLIKEKLDKQWEAIRK